MNPVSFGPPYNLNREMNFAFIRPQCDVPELGFGPSANYVEIALSHNADSGFMLCNVRSAAVGNRRADEIERREEGVYFRGHVYSDPNAAIEPFGR